MDNSPPPPPNPASQNTAGLTPTAIPNPPPAGHVKKAHRFLLWYIFILLAAVLAGGIYAWQNSKVKNLNTQLASGNAQITALKKQVAAAEAAIPTDSNAGNAPDNPYAGYKTFCDDFSNICLRYPKDWTIAGSTSSTKTTETFTNATSSAVVSYDNPHASDKTEQVYYIDDINDLTIKNLGPKIVGRVLGSVPQYVFVDATYVSTNHVVTGQTMSFVNDPSFTTNVKNVTARLIANPTGAAASNITTTDQATAWFKSNDAATALKILESLYYQ